MTESKRRLAADVLVLEKGTRFGGSMALSNGIVWSFASSDDVRTRLREGNPALQDLVVEQLPAGMEWLVSHRPWSRAVSRACDQRHEIERWLACR